MDGSYLIFSSAIVVALAYGAAHLPLAQRWQPPQPPLLLLLVFALAIRWLFLLLYPEPGTGDLRFDAESYRLVADTVRQGKDVYATTLRHPYLPFHMYWFAFAVDLEDWFGSTFFSWVRWPNILADLGILAIIYRGSLKLGRSASMAFWLGFLWAVQPVSIFHSVLHGQFHSVAIFFALLAWYLLRFWPGWRGVLLGGLALGFGVLDHSWPIIFVPVFLLLVPGLKSKAVFLSTVAAVPLLFFLIYDLSIGTSFDIFRVAVIEHEPTPGRFGISWALDRYPGSVLPDGWIGFATDYHREVLLGTLAIVAATVIPRRDTLVAATAIIAAIYAATFSMGSQQMLWIIPFALMAGQVRMLALYSAALIPGLFIHYWGTCGFVCPGLLSDVTQYWSLQLIWPVAIFWMLREVALSIPWRETFAAFMAGLRGERQVRPA